MYSNRTEFLHRRRFFQREESARLGAKRAVGAQDAPQCPAIAPSPASNELRGIGRILSAILTRLGVYFQRA